MLVRGEESSKYITWGKGDVIWLQRHFNGMGLKTNYPRFGLQNFDAKSIK